MITADATKFEQADNLILITSGDRRFNYKQLYRAMLNVIS